MLEFFEDKSYDVIIKTKIDPDYYYTTSELAQVLHLSKPEKVMNWVRLGLRAKRSNKIDNQFGGKYLILGKDVIRYLLCRSFRYFEMLEMDIPEEEGK
jgi:hypothetical protein